MSSTNAILAASLGLSGGEYIAPGETCTPPAGKHIGVILPIGGDAIVSSLGTPSTPYISNIPSPITLTQDVAYPLLTREATLDGGSAGGAICYFI